MSLGPRKRRSAEQRGVFPNTNYYQVQDLTDREEVITKALEARAARELARQAGLPAPEHRPYQNLGNRELPIYQHKSDIEEMVRDNPISVLEGPTGSGKSTQLPQYLLEIGYEKIYLIVPRIEPANNVENQIYKELRQQIGPKARDLIGLRHSEQSTGIGRPIEVITPDTFLRIFSEVEQLGDAPVAVIDDEIHEANIAAELSAAVTASQLESRPNMRLILASATLNVDKVRNTFSEASGREVPLASVEGRPFDLAIVEEPDLTIDEAYEKYKDFHTRTVSFTAGKEEVKRDAEAVTGHNYSNTRVDMLYASLPRSQKRKAIEPSLAENERQFVPSTNVAQSGMTFAGLTLVLTDGTTRRPWLDSNGVAGLRRQYSTQDEIYQQGGRAGRDVPGGTLVICKPSDDGFEFVPLNKREPFAPAEIENTNISNNVLAVASLGLDFRKLHTKWLMNKANDQRVLEAYEVLYRLGAIDEHNRVTDVGREMNKLPLRPELSRAVVQAKLDDADPEQVRQLVAMVCAVNSGGLPYFERGVGSVWQQDVRKGVADDYMAQLDMFLATRKFFDGKDVDERALHLRNYDIANTRNAHRAYDKVCRRLGYKSDNLPAPARLDEAEELYGYLAAGLFDHAYTRHSPDSEHRDPTYVSINGNDNTQYELSSRSLYKGGDPMVVGLSRSYEAYVKNGDERTLKEFWVVEEVAPVTKHQLAQAALWLTTREPLAPRVDRDGRLVQSHILKLGDVALAKDDKLTPVVGHTPESRKLLREAAFSKGTHAVSQLRAIKKQIEELEKLVPPEDRPKYFPDGTLDQDMINAMVNAAITEGVISIYDLDNNLRARLVGERISLQTWVSTDSHQEIERRSPRAVELNGQIYSLHYRKGQPTINHFNFRDADALPAEWLLPDGREIKITYSDGRKTRRYSAKDIKQIAERN